MTTRTHPTHLTRRQLTGAARDWRPVFLAELARTRDVARAARKAGVDPATAQAARADPLAEVVDEDAQAFTAAWDRALAPAAEPAARVA